MYDPVFLYLVAGTVCCPGDEVPSSRASLSQVFSTSLLSGTVKYSRLIWRISCSQPLGVALRHLLSFVGLVLESKINGGGVEGVNHLCLVDKAVEGSSALQVS